MATEVGFSDEGLDCYFQLAGIERASPLWHGRAITNADEEAIVSCVASRIMAVLQSQDAPLSAAAYFAYLGSLNASREKVLRDCIALTIGPDGAVLPIGFWSKTYEFYQEHKVAIWVGVAVVAMVSGAVIVAACCSGQAAAASSPAEEKKPPPQKKNTSNDASFQWPELPPLPQDGLAQAFEALPYTDPSHPFLYPSLPPLEPKPLFPIEFVPSVPIAFHPETGPKWIHPPSHIVDQHGVHPFNLPKETESASLFTRALQALTSPIDNPIEPLIQAHFAYLEDPNHALTRSYLKTLFPNSFISTLPKAPFVPVPLLGEKAQPTLHFHCGISNNFTSIVEGGLALRNSVSEKLAVQPHLIHPNSLVKGLSFVGLEKVDDKVAQWADSTIAAYPLMKATDLLIESSFLQRSINYEVAVLSQKAQEILEKNNPKLKQVHITFSNGGYVFREALQLLPPEYRDTIIVVTLGTTAIIDSDAAHRVYNIIGKKDWPSITCNGGIEGIKKAKDRAHVRMVPQKQVEPKIGGHFFMQENYQYEVNITVNEGIASEYEIY